MWSLGRLCWRFVCSKKWLDFGIAFTHTHAHENWRKNKAIGCESEIETEGERIPSVFFVNARYMITVPMYGYCHMKPETVMQTDSFLRHHEKYAVQCGKCSSDFIAITWKLARLTYRVIHSYDLYSAKWAFNYFNLAFIVIARKRYAPMPFPFPRLHFL